MLVTDAELIDAFRLVARRILRRAVKVQDEITNSVRGKRYLRVDNCPLPYEKAYDWAFGEGAYEKALAKSDDTEPQEDDPEGES